MSIDDEFEKLLGAKAAASEQLQSTMGNVAVMLGQFRSLLLNQGFTTDGAEDLTLEWFTRILDAPRDDDD